MAARVFQGYLMGWVAQNTLASAIRIGAPVSHDKAAQVITKLGGVMESVSEAELMHAKALAGGDRNAAVCTDCHTSHAVMDPSQPRQHIPQTCAQCHSQVFDIYATSVHGSAVMIAARAVTPAGPAKLRARSFCSRLRGWHQDRRRYNLPAFERH